MSDDDVLVPNRPSLRRASSLDDYKAWVREWIEARATNGSCYPHHEEEYDLVVECPLCEKPARIDPLSGGDAPTWSCMLARVPGHHVVLEGDELVATDMDDGTVARGDV